ncbi:ATP-grasp domain-containing protein [Micromonospora sp. SD12]|uniref:ATP-grasp domain-containing protein n=1 Tax=Micromonospora sp. SD12 TaxID=3452216 RepID=UPI003F885F9B
MVIEEPEISAIRDVPALLAGHPCVASFVTAPTQAEGTPERLVEAIERPAQVSAVLPSTEYGVVGASALAQAWGLPGAGLAAATVLRDKARLRTVAAGAGIPQPDWILADGPEDLSAFRQRHGGRCVLKPTTLQASIGVQRLAESADSAQAWAISAGADEVERRARYAAGGRILVERWLTGSEVSVECLVHEGQIGFFNVTAKTVQDGRFPVEMAHVAPAPLPAELIDRLRLSVEELIGATQFRTGVLHSEWIIEAGVPHLVECAGRLPGDYIDQLLDFAYGGSLVARLLEVLAGGKTEAPAAEQGAAVRFLGASPGRVSAITGVDQARERPGVLRVAMTVDVGDVIAPITDSNKRCGYVIARGADGAAAAALADEVARGIQIQVEGT